MTPNGLGQHTTVPTRNMQIRAEVDRHNQTCLISDGQRDTVKSCSSHTLPGTWAIVCETASCCGLPKLAWCELWQTAGCGGRHSLLQGVLLQAIWGQAAQEQPHPLPVRSITDLTS